MTAATWLGIPAAGERRRCFGMSAVFLVVFATGYVGADWLSAFVPWRLHVDFAFERAIPFVPWLAFVYLSVDLLLLLAPFVLRTWRQLFPLFATLVAETAIAVVCFLLLPVETRFGTHATPPGVVGGAFQVADALNLERNFLPSLHVAYAWTAALAYRQRHPRLGAAALAWALAIAASTLLLYQHHLVDVLAGLVLAAGSWWTVGRWARRQEVLTAWDIELLCLENELRFARRHVRYAVIGLALVRASLPGWRRNRLLRTGFCALQAIDDLLDGDRDCAGEPLDLVEGLVTQIESGRFADDDLARLVAAFTQDLRAVGGEPALADAVRLIRVMQEDRRRRRDGLLLDAASLREHHRQTFALSVDLMLLAGRAELRAVDAPELVEALGWCSAVRDLEEDLRAGLINLPREVVHQAIAEMPAAAASEWPRSLAVREWLDRERQRASVLLDQAEARLATQRDRRGASTLAMFARSMRRYAKPA
jgi:membrane-associated phospholipid phosphatase